MQAITVLALDTALASSVSITIDVLAMANRICEEEGRPLPFAIRLVGTGAHLFRPFLVFPESDHLSSDLMIVPAQGFSKAPGFTVRLAGNDVADARREIRLAYDGGAHIASSCTGTLLLAREGLLDARKATTAWWLAPVFAELFPQVHLQTSELILTDGPITTAGAAMAQMDMMVRLVARFAGASVAEACMRRMVLDERRSQTPYMAIDLLAATNESVAKAATWARSRLENAISVNDMAYAVGQSPRTFARRVVAATGMPPVQFLQQMRLERALELLETTLLPFEEIACRVGYADSSTLRFLIRRSLGASPRELRERAKTKQIEAFFPLAGLAVYR